MDEALQRETRNLVDSWMQHDAGLLVDYLVSDVEDPRLNIQSILTRHFLIVSLFGARFERLLDAELRFASVLNWACALQGELASSHDYGAIAHALRLGADDAEGIAIPNFVSSTYRLLPRSLGDVRIHNYIDEWLELKGSSPVSSTLPETVVTLFERLWSERLEAEPKTDWTVLEPACGSANDYRFLVRYGLARLIHYSGFDLCEKNVRNALQLFPDARFTVGNAFEIQAADGAYDYCLVHDLFEHLSLQGMDRALQEICRVTRRAFCFGLFNGYEGDEHRVQPLNQYHWNRLSVPLLRQRLERAGFDIQIVHIDTFLKWRFGCDRTHNKNAYNVFGERRAPTGTSDDQLKAPGN